MTGALAPFSISMSSYDFTLPGIDDSPIVLDRFRGATTLIVNVASACGLATQYAALQELHDRFADRGFSVIGVPCNQFGEQEPGGEDEIVAFCSGSYGVTFPLTRKVEVNGVHRHPLYAHLTQSTDGDGIDGEIRWNFEKFVVGPEGQVVGRFHPFVTPDADEVVETIERTLAAGGVAEWEPATAADVRPGDRVRLTNGTVVNVTRIESDFLGNEGLVGLFEDSPVRWLARPLRGDVAVEVLRRR